MNCFKLKISYILEKFFGGGFRNFLKCSATKCLCTCGTFLHTIFFLKETMWFIIYKIICILKLWMKKQSKTVSTKKFYLRFNLLLCKLLRFVESICELNAFFETFRNTNLKFCIRFLCMTNSKTVATEIIYIFMLFYGVLQKLHTSAYSSINLKILL